MSIETLVRPPTRTRLGRVSDRRRDNRGFIALIAAILITGVLLVGLSIDRSGGIASYGEHWHAALGVYVCDHWDHGADWPTPVGVVNSKLEPVRIGTHQYAGLHSHHDGLIHLEPDAPDELGRHATLGTYFRFNGFELSTKHLKFVSANVANGDLCGGRPGRLHWFVNGHEHTGNPAHYVLHNGDRIVLAFVADGTNLKNLTTPPSAANLARALGDTRTAKS